MTEPEVSLRIAIYYIQKRKTSQDVEVSIDGAHVKTKDTVHFDVSGFLKENGFRKCDGIPTWQGSYQHEDYEARIKVHSRSGEGDVVIVLDASEILHVESKKIKSGNGGEYPAMHEAIGQVMTGCPDDRIPVVALPYSEKSHELAQRWLSKRARMRLAGIHFALVLDNGNIEWVEKK